MNSNHYLLIYAVLLAGVVLAGVVGEGALWKMLAIAAVIVLLSPPVRRYFSGLAHEEISGRLERAGVVLWLVLVAVFLVAVVAASWFLLAGGGGS